MLALNIAQCDVVSTGQAAGGQPDLVAGGLPGAVRGSALVIFGNGSTSALQRHGQPCTIHYSAHAVLRSNSLSRERGPTPSRTHHCPAAPEAAREPRGLEGGKERRGGMSSAPAFVCFIQTVKPPLVRGSQNQCYTVAVLATRLKNSSANEKAKV